MTDKKRIIKILWYYAVFYTVVYKMVDIAIEIDDIWERSF